MSEVKIGLETHIQIDTDTKLFCSCPNREAEEPNTVTCPTCLGHPGSKPRTNGAAIDAGLKAGLALDCDIADELVMSRKTYFYPDMAKNFQITQYEEPIASSGHLAMEGKEIGIRRVHIEEDPARIIHKGGNMGSSDYTLVDYNRSGTPLLEVVTEPDLRSPAAARQFLQRLVRIMEYLGVYDRESGTVRSDANISIEGGNRVEVKNINGTAGVEEALEHEISRQERLVENDETVERETRNFDAEDGVTRSVRSKEEEEEYGYIFEPDLVAETITEDEVATVRAALPELPDEKEERLRQEYGVGPELVQSLITDPELADAFEDVAERVGTELAASWFSGPVKKTLNYHEMSYAESSLTVDQIAETLEMLSQGTLSDRAAETVLQEMVEHPRPPREIVEEQGLEKASGSEVEGYVEEVVGNHPDAVEDYRNGEEDALNFLIGKVMERSGGSADPKEARELLEERL